MFITYYLMRRFVDDKHKPLVVDIQREGGIAYSTLTYYQYIMRRFVDYKNNAWSRIYKANANSRFYYPVCKPKKKKKTVTI